MTYFWEVLGIDPTKDKKKIKKAYSHLIKKYHPEDHPEDYLKIREAYEAAIRYANTVDYNYDDFDYNGNQNIEFDITYQNDEEQNFALDYNVLNEKNSFYTNTSYTDDDYIIAQTQNIYQSRYVNEVNSWRNLFNNYVGKEEIILSALFKNDLKNITNESVILYLKDLLNTLKGIDNKAVIQRKFALNIQEEFIKRTIPYSVMYNFMYLLCVLLLTCAVFIAVPSFAVYGFRFFFTYPQNGLLNLSSFIINTLVIYQIMIVVFVIFDSKEAFYFRNPDNVKAIILTNLELTLYLMIHYVMFSKIIVNFPFEILFIIILLFNSVVLHKIRYNGNKKKKVDIDMVGFITLIICLLLGLLLLVVIIFILFNREYIYIIALVINILCLLLIKPVNDIFLKRRYEEFALFLQKTIIRITLLCYAIGIKCIVLILAVKPVFQNGPLSFNEFNIFLILIFLNYLFTAVLFLNKKRRINYYLTLPYNKMIIKISAYINFKCDNGKEFNNLNEYEKALYYVLMFEKEIKEGCFKEFLLNKTGDNFDEIVKSLEVIQAFAFSSMLEKCKILFRNTIVPDNLTERRIELSISLKNEKNKILLDDLDLQYQTNQQELAELIAQYINIHSKELI